MMSWRRRIFETALWLTHRTWAPAAPLPRDPDSIFLLQPSHIGDILVDTPLFEALHKAYVKTKIVVAAGSWNVQTLRLNPNITDLVPLDMPWNNTFVTPQGLGKAIAFIFKSSNIRELREKKLSIGIDLIGTQLSSMLLMRLAIPYRIGIRGDGGGFTAFHQSVPYDEHEPMARTALRLAELLGVRDLPSLRPQIFLSPDELTAGQELWGAAPPGQRVIIGPSASFAHKAWPLSNFEALIRQLLDRRPIDLTLVGGNDTIPAATTLTAISSRVRNLTAQIPLRHTFALVAAADLVICNSNMLMHVAAAFGVPAIVVLSAAYPSARQHKIQWGYDITTVLGRDADHPEIYNPQEVFEIASRILQSRKSGQPLCDPGPQS